MGREFNLMVAPNGARLTKAQHTGVPISPTELAQTAEACFGEGARAIHLHVRDGAQQHSLDAGRYRAAIAAIKETVPDMKIQVSTEAAGIFTVAEQIHCLKTLRPSAASVSVREIARDPDLVREAYAVATDCGTEIEHILYAPDDLYLLMQGFENGSIPDTQRRVLFVLGRYSETRTSQISDLTPFLDAQKGQDLQWSVCAFGPFEGDCLLHAIENGGNARIGFENNTIAPDGQPFSDNAASVANLVSAARKLGHHPTKAAV